MDYRRVAELYDPRRRVGGTGYLIQSNLVLNLLYAPLLPPVA